MSDIQLASGAARSTPPGSTSQQKAPSRAGDVIFGGLARLAAIITLLLLGGIIVSLVVASMPSIKQFGLAFLWTADWDPPSKQFGALVPIYGTIATSLIALIIAVPVSFGIALFLTELAPAWLRRPLGIAIELLAAIPSIVYGMWGLAGFRADLRDSGSKSRSARCSAAFRLSARCFRVRRSVSAFCARA